jgi:hypothetical protein
VNRQQQKETTTNKSLSAPATHKPNLALATTKRNYNELDLSNTDAYVYEDDINGNNKKKLQPAHGGLPDI